MSYNTPYFAQPAYYRQAVPQQQNNQAVQLRSNQQQVAQPGAAQQLAEEEAQVLAYLQSVRRRREAAEAAAALEARQRAQAQKEREAALKQASQRHAELVAAARRERAIRETLERERAREAAFAQAVQARRQEAIQQAVEEERKRQAAAAEAYARGVREAKERAARSQQQAQKAKAVQQPKPTAATAAALEAPSADENASQADLDALNELFGALFGFNLSNDDKKEQKQEQKQPAAPKPVAQAKQVAAPAKSADHEDDGYAGLPADLNDLLSQFLGLEVSPAQANEVAQNPSKEIVGNAVGGLNEFLSQYGLEFVPDSDDEDHAEEEEAAAPQQAQQVQQTQATQKSQQSQPQQKAPTCGWWVPEAGSQQTESKPAPKAVTKPEPAQTPAAAAKPAEQPKPVEKAESAAAPSPPVPNRQRSISKPDYDAPFTSTLGNYQNLPPFLREILTNIEGALAEDDKNLANVDRRKARKQKAHERRQQRAQARAEHRAVADDAAEEGKEIEEHRNVAAAAAHVGKEVEADHAYQKDEKRVGKDEPQNRDVAAAAAGKDEPRAIFQDAAEDAAQVGKKVEDEGAYKKDEKNVGKNVDQTRDVAQAASAEASHRTVADAAAAKGAAVEEHRDAYIDAAKVGKKVEQQHAFEKDAANVAINVDQNRTIAADTKPQPHASKHKHKAKKSKAKNAAPPYDPKTASPEAQAAFKELEGIKGKLTKLNGDFKFPAKLAFAPSPTDATQPPLLFNRTNLSYHAQANALLQLLLEVDGVQSGGDRSIRGVRKDLVTRIEDSLSELEAKRDARWAEVKERREAGESDDEDDWDADATTEDESSAVA